MCPPERLWRDLNKRRIITALTNAKRLAVQNKDSRRRKVTAASQRAFDQRHMRRILLRG